MPRCDALDVVHSGLRIGRHLANLAVVGRNGDGGGITQRPDLEVRRELESFFPQSNDL